MTVNDKVIRRNTVNKACIRYTNLELHSLLQHVFVFWGVDGAVDSDFGGLDVDPIDFFDDDDD
tara:strand:+ start:362 stop:550 length:189 start_codon:yes stop_codon:yes gene_type:complete